MLARGSGRILNVSSPAARLAWPGAVAYIAARSAMAAFTQALRADLHGSGIAVTLVMLGTVETPYWANNPGSRERLPKQSSGIPVLSPQKAASLIVAGIEKGSRTIVAPAAFRALFLLNSLFPAQTEAALSKKS
jgi:short-subunit dehydrogenase